MDYNIYLQNKSQSNHDSGFEPSFMHPALFDFQKALVEWSVRKGRSAIFADCGLGKTLMQLTWAQNVINKTSKPVLILTPLAVSAQTVAEAEKFDFDACKTQDGEVHQGINVTNYERLENYKPEDFGGCVCDESSILKSFNGATKDRITTFMRKMNYRLLCTATAAPNDYIELGTSSEALGYLGYMDMLNRFFINDKNNSALRRQYGEAPKWRFKGHSEKTFWRWVTGWARAVRKPSDLGFSDDGFDLPDLVERHHVIGCEAKLDGYLFNLPATNLQEQREERRNSIGERCEKVASLVPKKDQCVIWCHLNDEAKRLRETISGSVEISGSTSESRKEQVFLDFANGDIKTLITKPKIASFGMNWQSCHRVITFPSHSYEQYYQSIRRCWRYGQTEPVTVDIVLSEGEKRVFDNLMRKSSQAAVMFDHLVANMNDSIRVTTKKSFDKEMETPSWLTVA